MKLLDTVSVEMKGRATVISVDCTEAAKMCKKLKVCCLYDKTVNHPLCCKSNLLSEINLLEEQELRSLFTVRRPLDFPYLADSNLFTIESPIISN